jgi:hypothetical protein
MKFLRVTTLTLVLVVTSTLFLSQVTGHGGGEPECTYGKLYMTSRNNSNVYVYDLNQPVPGMKIERNVTFSPFPTNELSLDVTSDSQHVAVTYRGTLAAGFLNGVVNWINTGFAVEDHGDHYHLINGVPTLLTTSMISCGRPTHGRTHGGKYGLFCDGSYDAVPQTNASLWVVDEAMLGTSMNALLFNNSFMGTHHGIAVPLSDNHVLHSLTTPERINRNSTSSLPSTFQITDFNGNIVHSLTNMSDKALHCQGFHGSVANNDTIALACDGNHGGILIINYLKASKTFTSRALFYPPGFTGHRTSSLTSHPKSPYVIGNFVMGTSTYMIAFQTSDIGPLTNSSLLPLPVAQCGYRFELSMGEYLLAFMPSGTLLAYTYDKMSSWKLRAQVSVVPGMTACSQASFITGHQQAFVMHFSTQTLYAIDLKNISGGVMTVSMTMLPFTPNSAVVAGVPSMYSCGLRSSSMNNVTVPTAPVPAPVAPVPAPVAPVPAPVAPVPAPVASVPTRAAPVPTAVAPVPTTMAPVPTTMAPVPVPTEMEIEPCGMFGLSIFCPRRGHCGFFRRLFNMGDCP